VVAPGEFAIRGGLLDLFPMGSPLPYRLDLLDDQLETIRAFDPDTQRGLYPVPDIRLLPGREFPIDEAARQAFRRRWRDRIEGDPSRSSVYKDVGNGIASQGIEYFLPLFFDATATLFDYLPADAVVVMHGAIEAAIQRFWNETSERHRFLARDASRPILPPADLFLNAEQFFAHAKALGRIALNEGAHASFEPLPALAVERRADDPVQRLRDYATRFGGRLLIVADAAGRRETIGQMFAEYSLRRLRGVGRAACARCRSAARRIRPARPRAGRRHRDRALRLQPAEAARQAARTRVQRRGDDPRSRGIARG
jgi:transcription-repair coupling factor (superfamily II helicase)